MSPIGKTPISRSMFSNYCTVPHVYDGRRLCYTILNVMVTMGSTETYAVRLLSRQHFYEPFNETVRSAFVTRSPSLAEWKSNIVTIAYATTNTIVTVVVRTTVELLMFTVQDGPFTNRHRTGFQLYVFRRSFQLKLWIMHYCCNFFFFANNTFETVFKKQSAARRAFGS